MCYLNGLVLVVVYINHCKCIEQTTQMTQMMITFSNSALRYDDIHYCATQVNTNTHVNTGKDAQKHGCLQYTHTLYTIDTKPCPHTSTQIYTQSHEYTYMFKNADAQMHTHTHSAREPSCLGGSLDVMQA